MTVMDTSIGRRTFLVGAGASGLLFGFAAHDGIRLADASTMKAFAPNLWFSMDATGKTVIRIDKAEMGQHVGTALAQILADELEVKWSDVSISHIGFDPKVGLHVTGGSWSVNWTFDRMSRAGAAGRIALIEAAAKKWGVPASQLSAKDSVISGPGGKTITYGELVKAGVPPKAFSKDEMKAIKLKAAGERRYIGKSLPALDVPGKTNGTAGFAIDVKLDGMVYATPATPPVRYGAKVKSVDDSAAKKIKGYMTHVVIEDPTGSQTGWVMAVANSYWTARKAALALKVDWDLGPNAKVSSKTINDESRRLIDNTANASTFLKEGDAEKAIASAKVKHEAIYTTTINIHAPLEPLNATVEIRDGVYHIYTGNQFQTLAMGLVPAALGIKPDKVVLHQQFLGGGFGRRLEADYLIMAALTAKAVQKPVKMIYSREADTEFDFTRPMTTMRVTAGSDGKKITGWKHTAASSFATARMAPGFLGKDASGKKFDPFQINGSDHWYTVPNQLVLTEMNKIAQAATPSGQLRSVAPAWTFWAVESMIDEMAHKMGVDPLALRLQMLDGKGKNAGKGATANGAKRLASVLQKVAAKAGYGKAMAKNSGIGLACVTSQERASAAWTATAANVTVNPADGSFTVNRLTVGTDLGTLINPNAVEAQVQGATLWGLSLATLEEVEMKDGRLQASNFDTYTPCRMENAPDLDVILVETGQYPVGCGEPAVTSVAPAIANAIFAATGARVRSLPITAEKVKAAL
ncbi:MAG: xanthine dehydrogenase family protein molybdopterin-binding subunit [Rhodospirillaceae bacterium]|nr:xanthine dehydrogenase family protein molybdopterin-binding subunit [Rhodospirillaceae bacterium]MYH39358.1 xanthine dehydrogenase family protein molybdopterin-binding subunit [Rhodospirillaceae bacterium]MYK13282.1 xanthine dehydrogenase family protein molybdopterin-binding subunit [Rhodospirillaceae bacterium]